MAPKKAAGGNSTGTKAGKGAPGASAVAESSPEQQQAEQPETEQLAAVECATPALAEAPIAQKGLTRFAAEQPEHAGMPDAVAETQEPSPLEAAADGTASGVALEQASGDEAAEQDTAAPVGISEAATLPADAEASAELVPEEGEDGPATGTLDPAEVLAATASEAEANMPAPEPSLTIAATKLVGSSPAEAEAVQLSPSAEANTAKGPAPDEAGLQEPEAPLEAQQPAAGERHLHLYLQCLHRSTAGCLAERQLCAAELSLTSGSACSVAGHAA